MAKVPNPEQIEKVKALIEKGASYYAAARDTGVSPYYCKQVALLTRGKQKPQSKLTKAKTVPIQDEPEGIAFTEGENVNLATVSFKGRERITTVEDLLRVAEVDTAIWQVESFVVNQWEMGFVGKDVDDNAVPAAYPLYQVKATLRRIKLLPVEFEPIAPINVTVKQRIRPNYEPSAIRKCVVIPDIQVGYRRDLMFGHLKPFHDRAVINVGLQMLADIKPDVVVFLGDNLDLPDWSLKYLSSPECQATTQTGLIELGWLYGKVRTMLPHAEIHVIEGNHDLRMQTAVITNLKQAYGLRAIDQLADEPALSIERLLNLKSLDIEYHGPYPHGRYQLNSNFIFEHGHLVRAGSGKTVAAMANDLRRNEAVGHIHRTELATKTLWTADGTPKVYQAWSFGTWASILPGVVPGVKSENNWQNAVGVIDYEVNSDGTDDLHDLSTVTPVIVYRDTAIYNGKRYKAQPEEEIIADIVKETGWDIQTGYFRKKASK